MLARYKSTIVQCILMMGILLSVLYLFQIDLFDINLNHSKHQSTDDTIGFVDLHVVTPDRLQCVETKLLLKKYRTIVCVHDVQKDTDVSGYILSGGIWEEHLVTRIVRILSEHSQFAFFDIGANIGMYTMYAASVGCKNVIAIECFGPNIERIRRAVQLRKVEEQVVIVPRALYNKSNVYLSLRTNIVNNIGSQRLNAEVSRNDNDSLIVQTIRFDDLLPLIKERNIQQAIIKIDIETSEHYLCETGARIFDEIDIPFVMMEWAVIKSIPARANLIQKFFTDRLYIPINPNTCQPETNKDYGRWLAQDIFWIKKGYTHLCRMS